MIHLPTAFAPAASLGSGFDQLAEIYYGARGALRAGREIERLSRLSDAALAWIDLTRDRIVAHALACHLYG